MNSRPHHQGATLIELMIYIAISTGILVGIGSVGWSVIEQKRKAESIGEVRYTSAFLADILTRDIREASGIVSPSFPGTSSTTLRLSSLLPTQNPVIYSISGGAIFRQSATGSLVEILPKTVGISGGIFIRTGATGTDQTISFSGVLKTGDNTLGNSFRHEFHLDISASQRAPQP